MARVKGWFGQGDNALERTREEMDDLPVVELEGPVRCAYEACGKEIPDGAYANMVGDDKFYCSDGCAVMVLVTDPDASNPWSESAGMAANFVRVKYK